MAQIDIPLEDGELFIAKVDGSLHVKGWGRDNVRVEIEDPDDLSQEQKRNKLTLSARDDLILRVPDECALTIQEVSGDANLSSLEETLTIGSIKDSLTLRDVAETKIEEVFDNLNVRDVEGDFSVEKVRGNLFIRDVEGDLTIESVNGNATVRDVEGEITIQNVDANLNLRDGGLSVVANANGNAILRQDLDDDADYSVSARGNITCRLDTTPNAKVVLESEGENILIQTDESSQVIQGPKYEISFGDEEAQLHLKAGGNIDFRCREDDEGFNFDLDFDFMDDIGSVVDEISGQVTSTMESQLEALNDQLESLGEQLKFSGEHAAHQAQRRVEAAQRRLERKLQARHRSGKHKHIVIPAAFGPHAKGEPVTEEERLLVLQMVQEKKISVEEAEMLLGVLEGRPAKTAKSKEEAEPQAEKDEEAKDS